MTVSSQLATLSSNQLNTWAVQARSLIQTGQLPAYIPLLAQANPNWFAVQIQTVDAQIHAVGDVAVSFPLMSIVKPLMVLFLLQLGEAVFSRVGMLPSDQPFNSLAQLEADRGWPRNPMLNSGAIAIASMLPGQDARSRCESFRQWLNHQANCQLTLDEKMLSSVRIGGERNRAIAKLLAQSGYVNAEEIALDTYNQVCCLSGTVADLALLGMLLVQTQKLILPKHRRTVNALLTTCGLYEASGRFAVEVGIPTKSGVSGALLSVVPTEGAIACYSPALDPMGNSVAGLSLLKQLTQGLNLSIFG